MTSTLVSRDIAYLSLNSLQRYLNYPIYCNDGMTCWANILMLVTHTEYAKISEDSDSAMSVDLSSRQMSLILDFVHEGILPLTLAQEDAKAFEVMGISLTEKAFNQFDRGAPVSRVGPEPTAASVHEPGVIVKEEALDMCEEDDFEDPAFDEWNAKEPAPSYLDDQGEEEDSEVDSKTGLPSSDPAAEGKRGVCYDCNKTFQNLDLHRQKCHSGDGLQCEVCGKEFVSKAKKNKHRAMNHQNLVCELCGKVLTNKVTYEEHMIGIHGSKEDRPFKCDKCPRTFVNENKLRTHLLTHENRRSFVCDQCGRSYNTKAYLSMHRRKCSTVNGVSKYTPRGRKPNMEHYKNYRIRVVNGKEAYCLDCEKGFTGSCAPQRCLNHFMTFHNRDDLPFECETCGKKFNRKEVLKYHYETHEKLLKYECGVCGARFNNLGNRNAHEREVHLGIKKGQMKASRRKGKKKFAEEDFEARKARWMHDLQETKQE